jgi:hypothetical protein
MSIEKTYKSTGNIFTKCVNSCLSLAKIILISKFGKKFPKATSDSCIVLGNGPSLKQSLEKHPDFFKQHPLVCVNSFSVTDEYTILKPLYYVILDYSFWKSEAEIIVKSLDAIKTKTTWELNLFVPQLSAKSKRFEALVEQNKNIKLHYFNYTVFKGFDGLAHFFYAKNLAMPQSQNVLVASLFVAINTGFKKIYLVGADHTWHQTLYVNEQNQVCVKHVHFYEKEEKVNYVPFYKGGHTKEVFRMDEILHTWAKVFWGYLMLNKYAKSKGVQIVNASEVTFIDAFEQIKL